MRHGGRLVLVPIAACFLIVCLQFADAYPSGAPKCTAHTPKHKSTKAQTGKSPFKVTASAATKSGGKSKVTITITGTNDTKFKGFFLYASKVGTSDKIGTFADTSKSSVLTCGDANAITHSDDSEKSSIALTWTAPDDYSGEIEFKATVVKEFKEFWTGLKSAPVKI